MTHPSRTIGSPQRWEQARQQASATSLPTMKQLLTLVDLGYEGAMPPTQAEAEQLIDALRQQGGKP